MPASFLPLEGRLRYQETSLAPKLKIREDGNIKVRRRRTRTRTRTRRMAPTLLSAMLSIVFILTIPSTARAEDQAVGPTSIPSPTAPSTLNPSSKPTAGVELNTSAPSQSTKPSTKPTILLVPTSTPTSEPTTTPYPSSDPSSIPSDAPSTTPTSNPTVEPSLDNPSLASAKFRQMFTVGNGRLFTPLEIGLFEVLFPTYTSNFAPVEDVSSGRIESICEVTSQVGKQITGAKRFLRKEDSIGRMLQTFQAIEVDYIMSYNSLYTNVTTFPLDFQLYVNQNLVTVAQQLQLLGLNVTEAGQASRIIVQPIPTLAPTRSATPTTAPTMEPSVSSLPSFIPSDLPSLAPSAPQETLEPSGAITESPTQIISGQPTKRGSEPGGLTDNTVIVVSVVVAGSIVLIGLLLYYRKRKLHREIEYISNAAGSHRSNGQAQKHDEGSWNAAVLQPKQGDHKNAKALDSPNHLSAFRKYSSNAPPLAGAAGMVSPSESLVSNQSLLSAGNSMAGDSGDEADATGNLADEFDQYKDQNLEKMRADVEGNLAGFDGMMSQALTRALIDDDDANVDPTELLWGGQGKLRGAEIEASVLGEVTDWLKRQGGASVEVK